jgi:hypothetical protein
VVLQQVREQPPAGVAGVGEQQRLQALDLGVAGELLRARRRGRCRVVVADRSALG